MPSFYMLLSSTLQTELGSFYVWGENSFCIVCLSLLVLLYFYFSSSHTLCLIILSFCSFFFIYRYLLHLIILSTVPSPSYVLNYPIFFSSHCFWHPPFLPHLILLDASTFQMAKARPELRLTQLDHFFFSWKFSASWLGIISCKAKIEKKFYLAIVIP